MAEEVLALERRIEEAVLRADVAFLDEVCADDFTYTHGDGWTTGDPSSASTGSRSGSTRWPAATPRGRSIRSRSRCTATSPSPWAGCAPRAAGPKRNVAASASGTSGSTPGRTARGGTSRTAPSRSRLRVMTRPAGRGGRERQGPRPRVQPMHLEPRPPGRRGASRTGEGRLSAPCVRSGRRRETAGITLRRTDRASCRAAENGSATCRVG